MLSPLPSRLLLSSGRRLQLDLGGPRHPGVPHDSTLVPLIEMRRLWGFFLRVATYSLIMRIFSLRWLGAVSIVNIGLLTVVAVWGRGWTTSACLTLRKRKELARTGENWLRLAVAGAELAFSGSNWRDLAGLGGGNGRRKSRKVLKYQSLESSPDMFRAFSLSARASRPPIGSAATTRMTG